jgi:hypothetical protein
LAFQLDWYEANYACKNKGMFLVSVESREEDAAIIAQISQFFKISKSIEVIEKLQPVSRESISGRPATTSTERVNFTGTRRDRRLDRTRIGRLGCQTTTPTSNTASITGKTTTRNCGTTGTAEIEQDSSAKLKTNEMYRAFNKKLYGDEIGSVERLFFCFFLLETIRCLEEIVSRCNRSGSEKNNNLFMKLLSIFALNYVAMYVICATKHQIVQFQPLGRRHNR